MQPAGHIAHVHEIVVDAAGFDEGTLAAGNDVIHLGALAMTFGTM
jgi:hypothetical protein